MVGEARPPLIGAVMGMGVEDMVPPVVLNSEVSSNV